MRNLLRAALQFRPVEVESGKSRDRLAILPCGQEHIWRRGQQRVWLAENRFKARVEIVENSFGRRRSLSPAARRTDNRSLCKSH